MGWRVLVAIDGSPAATAALTLALTRFSDAEITALHVIDPIGGYHRVLAGGRFEEWHAVAKEQAETILQQAEDQAEREGHTIQTVCETGDTVETILEFAQRNDIEHIVMGTHGRQGPARYLLGSVTERVARRASVPVTLAKATDHH